jgi:hypothetical protein
MNKFEALAVLHEIYDACKEAVTMTCVSLDEKQVEPLAAGCQIRMKCDLDNSSRQLIEAILGKHNLTLREENSYVFIF